MATLKIVAKPLNIELDKGGTFRPIFYVLDINNAAINLTGYRAVMQIKVDFTDTIPLFDLTTENSGITITSPTTLVFNIGDTLNGVVLTEALTITNVYGIQPHISATLTSAITQDELVYNVDLIEPSLDVIKYLKGGIKLNQDGTT